jgi:hypothetical protein
MFTRLMSRSIFVETAPPTYLDMYLLFYFSIPCAYEKPQESLSKKTSRKAPIIKLQYMVKWVYIVMKGKEKG